MTMSGSTYALLTLNMILWTFLAAGPEATFGLGDFLAVVSWLCQWPALHER